MSLKSFVIPAALAALCTACQTVETTKESVVGVNRPQHMMVSADAVNQSADKAYHDVLAQAQKQNALDRDPATVERVKRIALFTCWRRAGDSPPYLLLVAYESSLARRAARV